MMGKDTAVILGASLFSVMFLAWASLGEIGLVLWWFLILFLTQAMQGLPKDWGFCIHLSRLSLLFPPIAFSFRLVSILSGMCMRSDGQGNALPRAAVPQLCTQPGL